MRTLKDWTKEEREELEDFKKNGKTAIECISLINSQYWQFQDADDSLKPALYKKYDSSNNDDQFAKDIADYFTGDAKFPEKRYHVHFLKDEDERGYLIRNRGTLYCRIDLRPAAGQSYLQSRFTEQEIREIDPRYMSFAVEVED